ncbi:hypothetical protein EDB19DRAFT_1832334 [Suillus lakei]|nr:hypothetical protein EDB19DRAFT_1832334 [Suillus lakei]
MLHTSALSLPFPSTVLPNATLLVSLLASAPNDALLFPKLHSLIWSESRLAFIPALRFLLPTLEVLSLCVSDAQVTKVVVPDLRTAAPRLGALEFVGLVGATGNASEIELLLLSYPEGLTELSLKCCNISSGLLKVIAGYESIHPVPPHVPQPFQALTHIHISCPDLELFVSFLRAFRMLSADSGTGSFDYLNLKTLLVNGDGPSPAIVWSQLVSILTHTKLEHMILVESWHYYLRHGYLSSSLELHPLLAHPTALTNIKTVVISTGDRICIALTNAHILVLARTCPHLNILMIGVSTPVSLYALGFLVGHCPALAAASLNINDQAGLQPNTRLRGLCIEDSPISCAGHLRPPMAPDLMWSIPRFLHTMAPRLDHVTMGRSMNSVFAHHWLRLTTQSNILPKVDNRIVSMIRVANQTCNFICSKSSFSNELPTSPFIEVLGLPEDAQYLVEGLDGNVPPPHESWIEILELCYRMDDDVQRVKILEADSEKSAFLNQLESHECSALITHRVVPCIQIPERAKLSDVPEKWLRFHIPKILSTSEEGKNESFEKRCGDWVNLCPSFSSSQSSLSREVKSKNYHPYLMLVCCQSNHDGLQIVLATRVRICAWYWTGCGRRFRKGKSSSLVLEIDELTQGELDIDLSYLRPQFNLLTTSKQPRDD